MVKLPTNTQNFFYGGAVRSFFIKLWHLTEDRPRLYLASGLVAVACGATIICRRGHLEPGLIQNLLGAQEIIATRHIYSSFLPITYPALIGWSDVIGSAFGRSGPVRATFTMQILILMGIVLFARTFLKNFCAARYATTSALVAWVLPSLYRGSEKDQ